ncbi:MAG: phosphatidate cytidylyltransferase [Halieaceae bacterium]|nr:phosphatidate cytidylyltransferase [Halieaceae bacterium]
MREDIRQRVITGISLAAGLIAALFYLPLSALVLLFGIVTLLAAWEWSNLAGYIQGWARIAYAFSLALVLFAVHRHVGLVEAPLVERVQPILNVACLWWSIALLWVMGYPSSTGLWSTRPRLGLMGMLVLIPTWLALVYLLFLPHGRWLLLYFFVLVAATDIGAYCAGKLWGRRQLAAALSPGKSLEGLCGGVTACALLALVTAVALPQPKLGLGGIAALSLITALASTLGDLLESMVKRHRGVKDSGTLLPGHGGILDRVDGHTAAAPVFALGLILVGW